MVFYLIQEAAIDENPLHKIGDLVLSQGAKIEESSICERCVQLESAINGRQEILRAIFEAFFSSF
jgi:hypothetical protein